MICHVPRVVELGCHEKDVGVLVELSKDIQESSFDERSVLEAHVVANVSVAGWAPPSV